MSIPMTVASRAVPASPTETRATPARAGDGSPVSAGQHAGFAEALEANVAAYDADTSPATGADVPAPEGTPADTGSDVIPTTTDGTWAAWVAVNTDVAAGVPAAGLLDGQAPSGQAHPGIAVAQGGDAVGDPVASGQGTGATAPGGTAPGLTTAVGAASPVPTLSPPSSGSPVDAAAGDTVALPLATAGTAAADPTGPVLSADGSGRPATVTAGSAGGLTSAATAATPAATGPAAGGASDPIATENGAPPSPGTPASSTGSPGPGAPVASAPAAAQTAAQAAATAPQAAVVHDVAQPGAGTPGAGAGAAASATSAPTDAGTLPHGTPVVTAAPAPTAAPVVAPSHGVSAPPAPQAAFAAQVTPTLFTLAGAKPGEHVITINVTPENLGPVTVRAHVTGESVRVELFAPTDAGRDALRTILPDLRRDLAGSGLNTALDLSSEDRAPDPEPQRRTPGESGRGPGHSNPESGTSSASRPHAVSSASTIDVLA